MQHVVFSGLTEVPLAHWCSSKMWKMCCMAVMLSAAHQSPAQICVWSLCIHVAGLKGQSLQGVGSTSQFHLAHKRVGNSWRHTQHMSASCEVCPTWALVDKQMSTVHLWRNVKEAADTAMRDQMGFIYIWVGCCWNANKGLAALLCWDEGGESWSWTRGSARYKMRAGRRSVVSKVSISLLFVLQLLAEDSKAGMD